jgi:hypothetical protein
VGWRFDRDQRYNVKSLLPAYVMLFSSWNMILDMGVALVVLLKSNALDSSPPPTALCRGSFPLYY